MGTKSPSLLGYILILPLVIWIISFLIYPIALTLYISFTDQKVIGGTSRFIGIRNYLELFSDPRTLLSVQNSLIWTLGNLGVLLAGGLVGALLLNQDFKGKWFVRTILILPWMIPTTAIAWIWRWILSSELGIINHWLLEWGLVSEPIPFLGSTQYAMLSSILVNSWRFIPINILLIYAALQMIPSDIYEAARVDGASFTQIFRYIILPYTSRVLAAVTLLSVMWIVNYFDFPWLLTGGGPALSTETIPIRLYRLTFQSYDFCKATALSAILFAALSLFAYIYIRRVRPF